MSLQLWMPLMGDLHNQGLGTYSISTLGTLSWVAGKLGAKAMKAGDGTQIVNGVRIEDTFTTLLNGPYSVSVWIKPYGDHIHYNGSIFSSGNWNTANKRWAFGVNQTNTKVDVLCSNYNTYIDCTVPVNEWTHLVCTCGTDRIVKLYKNGEYVASLDRSEANAFDSDATFTCIGRESYASGYFSFNGAIQDFRLYSHCLSEIEIKHLAQGLVLHYPLNRNGWGQENLLKDKPFSGGNRWTSIMDGRGVKIDWTSNAGDTYFYLNLGTGVTLTEGKTYTLSFQCSGLGSSPVSFYWCNLSGNSTMGGVLKNGLNSFTFAMPSANITNPFFDDINRDTTLNNLQMWNFKLEEGNKTTPWCPNSSDTLATTMGLNGTVEYDCSGFCNNGTRTGTFSWTSDTPKYSMSQYFDGSSYILTDSGTFSWFDFNQCTIAAWFKPTVKPSNYSGSIGIAHDQYAAHKYFAISNYGGTFVANSINGSTYINTTSEYVLPLNEWHHCVATLDGTVVKVYVDGVLKNTATINWNNAEIASDTRVNVGIDLPGTDEKYTGYYSDVRIYTTALSADDILSLYQNSATIDSNGVIHGQIR